MVEPIATSSWLNATASANFVDWLAENHCSLVLSTYQTGKIVFVGRSARTSATMPEICLFERSFKHCMGMCVSEDALWIGTRFQVWKLTKTLFNLSSIAYREDSQSGLPASSSQVPTWALKGCDFIYIPRIGYTTGYIDIHDLAVEATGQVLFANTMFNCVATLSDHASFKVIWKPSFITELLPEDRCHLNGLALRNGALAFVSVVSQTNISEGWRDKRNGGGCVINVSDNEVVCSGLCMPHSPRWYREQLWIHNSGTGEFGFVDFESKKFCPIAFLPGYLRGIDFVGDYAVVTLSKPRAKDFTGLPIDLTLQSREMEPECGIQVVDLKTGNVTCFLRFESELMTELYDVCILPGVRRPVAVGFQNDEIERIVLIEGTEIQNLSKMSI